MFSLCIPTMDRFDHFLSRYLPCYLSYDLISEIIICDENGNDVDKINTYFPNQPKLKLFKNENRLGPFMNKLNVCKRATNEWIALMDSDNFANELYFQTGKKYIEEQIGEQKQIILAPSKANPFDFSKLNNFIYKKGNFEKNNALERACGNSNSNVLMNTGNYILNKFLIDNLNIESELNNITMSSACDVVFFNTLLFEQLDLNLHVVPGLEYEHVRHDGSIYLQTCELFKDFNEYVYERHRMLR
jgi:hypothetical protein